MKGCHEGAHATGPCSLWLVPYAAPPPLCLSRRREGCAEGCTGLCSGVCNSSQPHLASWRHRGYTIAPCTWHYTEAVLEPVRPLYRGNTSAMSPNSPSMPRRTCTGIRHTCDAQYQRHSIHSMTHSRHHITQQKPGVTSHESYVVHHNLASCSV